MVTHSVQAASHAERVLFIKDGCVFHQIYKGNQSNEDMYKMISDTLTVLQTKPQEEKVADVKQRPESADEEKRNGKEVRTA